MFLLLSLATGNSYFGCVRVTELRRTTYPQYVLCCLVSDLRHNVHHSVALNLSKERTMTDPRLVNGRAVRDRLLRHIAERVAAARATRPIGRILSVSIGE